MLIWTVYRIFSKEKGDEYYNEFYKYKCFHDMILEYLNDITINFSQNLQKRDYLLILSSNSLDFLVFFVFIHFTLYCNSCKLILSLGMFYILRLFIQKLLIFSYYDIYLFDYPGFWSFTVPLFRASDFFYSGHVGVCFLSAYYLYTHKVWTVFIISVFILFLEAYTLIILRAHYCIDIIFGFFIAHYISIVNNTLVNLIDNTWKKYFHTENVALTPCNELLQFEMRLLT